MNSTALSKANRSEKRKLEKRKQVAARKIAAFEKQFGSGHQALLYQAALPLALTPDLLYRLWASFQRDIRDRPLNIPWVAVSDLLLSGLCEEVGQEIYELNEQVRQILLHRLQTDSRFGQPRIQEISDFLLEYVGKQLGSSDLDIRDFAQAQSWTVLAYTKPTKAARELALAYQILNETAETQGELNRPELMRMAALVETITEPLNKVGLMSLVTYARAMKSLAKGNEVRSADQLAQVAEAGSIQIADVSLSIPSAIENYADQLKPLAKRDYSGQNLNGQSFKGQILTGADFSGSDIRSADFTQTTLINANFSQAKMGLNRRWGNHFLLIPLLLSIMSGLATTLASGFLCFIITMTFREPLKGRELFASVSMPTVGVIITILLCLMTCRRTVTARQNANALAVFGFLLLSAILFFPITSLNLFVESTNASIVYFCLLVVTLFCVIIVASLMVGSSTKSQKTASMRSRGRRNLFFSVAVKYSLLAFGLLAVFSLSLDKTDYKVATIGILSMFVAALTAIETARISAITERLSTLSRRLNILAVSVSISVGILYFIVQATQNKLTIPLSSEPWLDLLSFLSIAVSITGMCFYSTLLVAFPYTLAGTASVRGSLVGTLLLAIIIALYFLVGRYEDVAWRNFAIASIIMLAIAAITWATTLVIAISINLTWAEIGHRQLALLWTLLGIFPPVFGAAYLSYRTLRWIPAISDLEHIDFIVAADSGIVLFSAAISGIVLFSVIVSSGTYLGWRSLSQDPKFISIQQLAIATAAKGGTCFHNADLTGANFTEATLKNTNFSDANLTGTKWFHAQGINRAACKNAALQSPEVQRLVTTYIGRGNSFNQLDLQGINLQNTALSDASFINTNLKKANLQDADFTRAKLVGTQLQQANLTGACLTGAYIQDIQIDVDTQLRSLECQYIFTKIPTKENLDLGRIPADRRQVFKPGEFAQFLRQRFATPYTKAGKT